MLFFGLVALLSCQGEAPCDVVAYPDADGDGWGEVDAGQTRCRVPEGWVTAGGDCDDTRAWVNPGAVDGFCDSHDANCDGGGGDEVALVVDQPYASIQEAVDGAAPGEAVWICPGAHDEALTIPAGADLTLGPLSLRLPTILEARTHPTQITVEPGAALTLTQLTLRYAQDSAIHAVDADLELEDCVLEGNEGAQGGAVRFETRELGGRLRITDSLLVRNYSSERGGAVSLDLSGGSAFVELVRSELVDNHTRGEGGAVSLTGSQGGYLAVAFTELRDNDAHLDGGAIFVAGDAEALLELDLEESTLVDNEAARGGALAATGLATVDLDAVEVLLARNQASEEGGAAWLHSEHTGSRDHLSSDTVGLRFDSNQAPRGGALALRSGYHTLSQASFTSNTATEAGGALLFGTEADPSTLGTLMDAGFDGNEAARGAALELVAGELRMDRSDLFRNHGGEAPEAAAMTLGLLQHIELRVTDTDWGTGESDNLPLDLWAPGSAWDDLDQAEHFECRPGGCVREEP